MTASAEFPWCFQSWISWANFRDGSHCVTRWLPCYGLQRPMRAPSCGILGFPTAGGERERNEKKIWNEEWGLGGEGSWWGEMRDNEGVPVCSSYEWVCVWGGGREWLLTAALIYAAVMLGVTGSRGFLMRAKIVTVRRFTHSRRSVTNAPERKSDSEQVSGPEH